MATGKTCIRMETGITFPDIPILENRITVETINFQGASDDFVTKWWIHNKVTHHTAATDEDLESAYHSHTKTVRLIDEWIGTVILDMEHQIAEYLDEEM